MLILLLGNFSRSLLYLFYVFIVHVLCLGSKLRFTTLIKEHNDDEEDEGPSAK